MFRLDTQPFRLVLYFLVFVLGWVGYEQFYTANVWILPAAVVFLLLVIGVETRIIHHPEPEISAQVIPSNNNLTIIAWVNKLLVAGSESDIIETLMRFGSEELGATGVTFLPYDEYGKSLLSNRLGTIPGNAEDWTLRLGSPATRQACKRCFTLKDKANCSLLCDHASGSSQVSCYPLTVDNRQVGLINLFLPVDKVLDETEDRLFRELIEAGCSMLHQYLIRSQEIAALHYLQSARFQRKDIDQMFLGILENIQKAVDVDFCLIYLPDGIPTKPFPGQSDTVSYVREGLEPVKVIPDRLFLEGIWNSVLASGSSLSIATIRQNWTEKLLSMDSLPLRWQGENLVGVLVLGAGREHEWDSRKLALLETLAAQAAMLISNLKLMEKLEYRAVLEERTRLAREIHDGLAQTLAFLKIQSSQIQSRLERGDLEGAKEQLSASHRTLSDAYTDARQAIDDLRSMPGNDFIDWLMRTARDFEVVTGQKVKVSVQGFPSELDEGVHLHLIRIVQEALNNIRKHAGSKNVSILARSEGHGYILEIHDDGKGFLPMGDVLENQAGSIRSSVTTHGIRGIRERSESIGADFQITSIPGKGTCVSLVLPVNEKEGI